MPEECAFRVSESRYYHAARFFFAFLPLSHRWNTSIIRLTRVVSTDNETLLRKKWDINFYTKIDSALSISDIHTRSMRDFFLYSK